MKISDGLKNEILATLKDKGLDVAEDAAVMATRAAFALMALLVPKVSKGLGSIIGPLIMIVEPKILELLDAIDGEDDPGY